MNINVINITNFESTSKNKNLVFGISLVISIVIHSILVSLVINKDNTTKSTLHIATGHQLQIFLVDEFIPAKVHSSEFDSLIETGLESNNKPPNLIEVTQKAKTIIKESKIIEPTGQKNTAFSYGQLTSAIETIITIDSQDSRQIWFKRCHSLTDRNEKKCSSTIQQLGLENSDPYDLAGAFAVLDKKLSSKKQQRLIDKNLFRQKSLATILTNSQIDTDMRVFLNNNLYRLKNELTYQDCGNDLNHGTCAGEVDLIKLSHAVIKLLTLK